MPKITITVSHILNYRIFGQLLFLHNLDERLVRGEPPRIVYPLTQNDHLIVVHDWTGSYELLP